MDKRLTDFLASLSTLEPKLFKYPLVVYTIVAPLLAVLFGSVTGALVLVLAGFAALLFIRAEDITELKFLTLQAKLEKSIKEANATISQLRALACTLAGPLVMQIALHGQLMTHETMPSRQLKINDIAKCLQGMGVPEAEIDDLLSPWKLMAIRHILGLFHQRLLGVDKEKIAPIEQFWKTDSYPPPSEILTLLDTIKTDDEILNNYKDLCRKLAKTAVLDDPMLFEVACSKASPTMTPPAQPPAVAPPVDPSSDSHGTAPTPSRTVQDDFPRK